MHDAALHFPVLLWTVIRPLMERLCAWMQYGAATSDSLGAPAYANNPGGAVCPATGKLEGGKFAF